MRTFDVERQEVNAVAEPPVTSWVVVAAGVVQPEDHESRYFDAEDAIRLALHAPQSKGGKPVEAPQGVVPGLYRVVDHDDRFGGSTRTVTEKVVAVQSMLSIGDPPKVTEPELEEDPPA